jgi:hypothetical protein
MQPICPPAPARSTSRHCTSASTRSGRSGSSHNVHLLENGDIGVTLSKGSPSGTRSRWDAERGTIVIALNVDESHDEAHYSNVAFRGGAEDLLSEAIETLAACRNELSRVRTS